MADEKKKPAEGTPSAIALEQVGKPKANASDEELNEHAAKYAAAKKAARWG